MKNECNVAKDLMPLVIDGVASEESKQYVDEHVAECTECAIAYGEMRVELPRANAEKECAEMEKAAKKVWRKRFFRGVAGGLAAVMIFLSLWWCLPKLTSYMKDMQFRDKYICENGDISLDGLYYDICSYETDSRIRVDIHSFPSGNPTFEIRTDVVAVNDNTGVCIQYHAAYKGFDTETGGTGFQHCSGRIEDGKWVQMADDVFEEGVNELGYHYRHKVSLPVVRLEMHGGDEVVVLWEQGDEVPLWDVAKAKREAAMAQYE